MSDKHRWRRIAFSTFAVLIAATALMGRPHNRRVEKRANHLQGFAEDITVSVAINNKYTKRVGHMYPWANVVEPLTETTFEVTGIDTLQPAPTVIWEIASETLVGNPVVWSSPSVLTGTKPLRIRVLSPLDGTVLQSHNSSVTVKYVRREIRDLDEDDRNRMLDAMQTLFTVNETTGQARYGSKFKGIAYFVSKHLDGASDLMCDHWHDDAGIVNHHIAFTLEFEQSMQSVNGAVSIPFWDFTIDAHRQVYHATPWEESAIFQDDWFGPASPTHKNHILDQGRWAFTATPRVESHETKHNSWGLLRAPWNTNPTPFITRYGRVDNFTAFTYLPDCETYMECFVSPTLAAMNECMNGATHGPVHINIGGLWDKRPLGHLIQDDFGYQALLMSKNLWRQGYLRCPETCVEGVTAIEDCRCGCPRHLMGNLTAYDVLVNRTHLINWVSQYAGSGVFWDRKEGRWHIRGYNSEKEDTAWDDLYELLCDPGHVGDMFTSASPFDPTFWLIHPTIDRLMHYRRLVADRMPFDETWAYAHSTTAPSDTGIVCHWDEVKTENELPTCVRDTCPGHRETDTIPFQNFLGQEETYTNLEMFSFLSPTNIDLPYMYADFRWEHCDNEGFAFGVDETGQPPNNFTIPAAIHSLHQQAKKQASLGKTPEVPFGSF